LESTQELTGQPIEKVYADGAYQQPMKYLKHNYQERLKGVSRIPGI